MFCVLAGVEKLIYFCYNEDYQETTNEEKTQSRNSKFNPKYNHSLAPCLSVIITTHDTESKNIYSY